MRRKIAEMIIDALKLSLLTYLKNLGLYDYLAFAWFFVTFFMLIVLAIIIAKRSSAFSLLLIILSVIFFVSAPFAIQYKLNILLRPTAIETTLVKKLNFSDTVIVEADIYNTSAKAFKRCLVQTDIIKQTNASKIKQWLNRLKPIANQSILVQDDISEGNFTSVRIVFDDFVYTGEINATLKAECY